MLSGVPPVAGDLSGLSVLHGRMLEGIDLAGNCSDAENDPLTIEIVAQPAYGSVGYNPVTGLYAYSSYLGEHVGPVSFTYRAFDGDSYSNLATVSITITNTTPTAGNLGPLSVHHGGSLTDLDLPGNASDADQDALTAEIVQHPSHGSLSYNAGSGTWSYYSDSDYVGGDSFTYQVYDGDAYSNVATVSFTVTNAAPVANDDGVYVVGESSSLLGIDLLANASDADGDPLSVEIVQQPAHGWLGQNYATGLFDFYPYGGYQGPDAFTFRVSDGAATSNIATVSLAIINEEPAVGGAVLSVTHDGVIDPIDLGSFSWDPEGASLTFTITAGPAHGSLSANPDGTYQYQPDPGYIGSDSFSFTADDGSATSEEATIQIDVTNSVPDPADVSYATDQGQTVYDIDLLSSDYDDEGDALSVVIVDFPQHGTLVQNGSGTFDYTPDAGFAGGDFFTFTYSDGHEEGGLARAGLDIAAAATVTLQLTPPNFVGPPSPVTWIHINDNFDEQQISAADNTRWVSDFMPNPATGRHQIVANDSDLKAGFVTIGPAGSVGQLTWTIGPGVRVWWNPSGTWVEVSNNANYTATRATILLRVEGNAINNGSIQVTFTPTGGAAVSNARSYQVYTGLRINGAGANVLVTQLQQGSNYGLQRDANGNVWRTGGARQAPQLQAWQGVFRTYIDQIFANEGTRLGNRITAINAVSNTAPVTFGSYDLGALDVVDIGAVMGADTRHGAAILIHEVVEQYRKQIYGEGYLTTPGDEDGGGAHTAGILAENAVTGGRRGRPTIMRLAGGGPRIRLPFVIDGGPNAMVFELTITGANREIGDVRVTRP